MSESSGFRIIAIDGGAATGKSSTSRAIAERLKLMHVDTGAHYRTLTYAILDAHADLEAIPTLLKSLKLGTMIERSSAQLSINGHVPADTDIRSPQVNANVSKFAAIESVRECLFNYQRSQAQVARKHADFTGLIMEGRDIGSVIFPKAEFRFFLFADTATRAARRTKDGQTDSIIERDRRDKQRKTAPLVCPQGATRIDTGSLPLESVIDYICQIITEAER